MHAVGRYTLEKHVVKLRDTLSITPRKDDFSPNLKTKFVMMPYPEFFLDSHAHAILHYKENENNV